jgi:hypothetical protein
MSSFPWSSIEYTGIPFGWTLISIIITWGIGVGITTINPTSLPIQIVVTVLFSVQAIVFSIATIIYLFRAILNPKHNIRMRTPLKDVLTLLDVWFSLLTAQAGGLYIAYLFWPTTALFGLTISNGTYYVFLQMVATMANNFHGSTGSGVIPLNGFAYTWFIVCSIISRIFLIFAVPIVLRLAVTSNSGYGKMKERPRGFP